MQLLRAVDVGSDVEHDVAEKAQGHGQRPVVVGALPDLLGLRQRVRGPGVLGEPVTRFAGTGQRAALAHAPVSLGTGEHQRAAVAVDRAP